jgi:uncharacterized protein YbcV (DUF1398 family)
MFTKEQIEVAHAKVKDGADFPKYVQEIKSLGVKSHEVVLTDGTWIFKGNDNCLVEFQRGLESVQISPHPLPERFKHILSIHQQGETDYPTFCIQAGEAGVERWISDFESMTVTYLDKDGQVVIRESIPVI